MKRFWIELLLGGASALAAFTLAMPLWVERLFGVDPDGGSGALEWLLACGLLLVALALSIRARREWGRRRLHRQAKAMTTHSH